MHTPFPKHVCGHEWYPNLKDNEFYRLHLAFAVALLRFHVWLACCKHNLKRRGGNLSSGSKPAAILRKPPGPSGRTNLSVIITVTDQNHGYLVIISWPRFCLQTLAHSFLTTRWKWNTPPHPSSFLLKFMNFAVLLKLKVAWDFQNEISLHPSACRWQDLRGWKNIKCRSSWNTQNEI